MNYSLFKSRKRDFKSDFDLASIFLLILKRLKNKSTMRTFYSYFEKRKISIITFRNGVKMIF
jgi:hypothetical protein